MFSHSTNLMLIFLRPKIESMILHMMTQMTIEVLYKLKTSSVTQM